MFIDIEKYKQFCLLPALLLICPGLVVAAPATMQDCRPHEETTQQTTRPLVYSNALLWKISKNGQQASYIFGTIHVSDPRITNLPEPVHAAIDNARVFVMEALPDQEESMKLSKMMFFNDGKKLHDYLDDDLFTRAANILDDYKIASESINFLKPWAAFIIMSYPSGDSVPLDLQLLGTARNHGLETRGLETLSEQGQVFSSMDIQSQVRLLLDTLCNYDKVSSDFESMKILYLKKDLQALYNYSQKYSFPGDKLYDDLFQRLLIDRNHMMAERMQQALGGGNAFIAIGAMHLPGDEGVLALLHKQDYTITAVY
jgi:uncharacterized protein YbaP (TraB family)